MEAPTTTSPTPETDNAEAQASSAERQYAFNPREVLNLKTLENLRIAQQDAHDNTYDLATQAGLSNSEAEERAKTVVVNAVDTYLVHMGLAPEDDRYLSYKGALLNLSIITTPESEWYAKYVDGKRVQSGRDKARASYRKLTGKGYDDIQVEDDTQEETDPENQPFKEEKEKLDNLRANLATLSAKRQGASGLVEFGRKIFGGKESGENYEAALKAYNEQNIVLGKLETQDALADDSLTEAEKNAKIIEYLFAEQNALRKESMDKLAHSKVWKFNNKFAEYMNRGTMTQRIVKAGLIGVGISAGALIAITAATAAGFAVAGTAAVVGTAAAGARFGRAYAMQQAKHNKGIGELDASEKDSVDRSLTISGVTDGESAFDLVQARFNMP